MKCTLFFECCTSHVNRALNHNTWRIRNDLNWLLSNHYNSNELYSLYWLDNNLKNVCFPWVLKLERQFKSAFIYFYKDRYQSDEIKFVLDKEIYSKRRDKQKKEAISKRVNDLVKENNIIKIDQLIFSLMFGEFVNFIIYFDNSLLQKLANHFRMELSVFVNCIKYLNILRNAIAHNKTIIKIIDEKNNKRYSLKKDLFNFPISKIAIDIISSNVSGSIFTIKQFLIKSDRKKVSSFIKEIKKQLKLFKKELNDNDVYNRFIRKIFLNYLDDILYY
ncbi:Abi family protein [Malacoplasma iowae]|uniref:Abi family protein n=1 Tax=Malacoplasma iowae TaxID=2116 RepID=UPI003872FBFF|nr:Abi family protein [Malacoplasma iowae]